MNSTIFLMSDDRFNTLVMAAVSVVVSIVGSFTAIGIARWTAARVAARVETKVGETKAEIGTLAKNIDGAMTELKETIAAKSSAEGQLKGIAGEQERVADLITEPKEVTEAMNGEDVREQINTIEAAVIGTQETLAETPAVRPAVRKQIDKIEKAVTDEGDKK